MPNTLKIFLSLLGLPLVLAACGDDTNNNPTGGGTTGPTLAELSDKVVDAYCASAVDCHRAETAAECLSSTGISLDGVAAGVEAGTVKYHPEKVDACLAGLNGIFVCAYTEQSTDPGGGIQAACEGVFEGTVADGGACAIDEACVSGNCEAVDPSCMDACCASKCAPKPVRAKVGESCVTASCEASAYCVYAMGMPDKCAAKVAEGQPCTDYSGCLSPSSCDLDFMTGMGTCKIPPAHGAACNPDSILACDRYDDYCDPTTKVCATLKAPGDACMGSFDCMDYAFCGATDKCEKLLVAGEACDEMAGPGCLGGLACTNGKCTLPPDTVCP